MDCVNCLIAFTNNPHSLEVALNSIAFLRFCASRLAEGSIGDLPEGVPALEPEKMGATRLVSFLDAFLADWGFVFSGFGEAALNSVAFLRFCASRLAEGSIGDLPEGVATLEPDKMGATRLVSFLDVFGRSFKILVDVEVEEGGYLLLSAPRGTL